MTDGGLILSCLLFTLNLHGKLEKRLNCFDQRLPTDNISLDVGRQCVLDDLLYPKIRYRGQSRFGSHEKQDVAVIWSVLVFHVKYDLAYQLLMTDQLILRAAVWSLLPTICLYVALCD
ncbi:MAG: hypothetical protein JWM11_2870 [Planctomycetaceae bacterium]|nr:hypothetical protein [Planctomycetaceae bacterium]